MSTVDQIMTRQLFRCLSDDTAEEALDYLRMLNIHAAPVFSSDHTAPTGMIAVSDLTGGLDGVTVGDRMSSPVVSVLSTAVVSEAARVLAENGLHHLIVTDVSGAAVGFVSALDVIRTYLGQIPAKVDIGTRPPTDLGLEWSGDEAFCAAGLRDAPQGPGLLVLTRVTDEHPPSIIWAEASKNIRGQLETLLADPPARLARILERGRLHFRAASAPDAASRRDALRAILSASGHRS